ncbi:MAG: patatin-like phospholipase family protein [Eubacterium sp.]|nr:patatin-like phospholipase family protein [Eubacterium sp.]
MEGTGLVLAGGGGKGIYQVGMIKSLSEAGLLDDVVAVSGTSIGGVNAVLFSEGIAEGGFKNMIEQMESAWKDIDYKVFFNVDPNMIHAGDSHFSRNATESLIDKYLDYSCFNSESEKAAMPTIVTAARCPVNVVTTQQITDEEIKLLTSASVEEAYGNYIAEYMSLMDKPQEYIKNAILATTALPVIYNPVNVDGSLYVDGGVKDNIPIKPLYDLGIRRFIVIELNTESGLTDTTEFADAEIIDILPSHDLGKLISGTMNFDRDDLAVKKEIGVRDGRRYVKTLFEKDEIYIKLERELAMRDYDDIVKNIQFEKKYSQLESDVSSRFDYIKNIEDMYK